MANRTLTSSLLGVMTGVLLGAGTLAWAQSVPLEAAVFSRFPRAAHPAAAKPVNRRSIEKLSIPLRDEDDVHTFPTIQSDTKTDTAPVHTMTVTTPCAAVKDVVMQIQRTYNSVTPVNLKNTDSRRKMDAVFADAVDDFCEGDESSASSASSTSSDASADAPAAGRTVDNNCGKYLRQSPRYTLCVINEGLGKKFP